MFSTFQATVKVAKNTKRETMCNLEKWIIKMVWAMNVLKLKSIFRPNVVNLWILLENLVFLRKIIDKYLLGSKISNKPTV